MDKCFFEGPKLVLCVLKSSAKVSVGDVNLTSTEVAWDDGTKGKTVMSQSCLYCILIQLESTVFPFQNVL